MLVLTRGINEVITIGDDVKITVVAIRGMKVRIGIEAPENTQIHRQEVFNRLKSGEPRRA